MHPSLRPLHLPVCIADTSAGSVPRCSAEHPAPKYVGNLLQRPNHLLYSGPILPASQCRPTSEQLSLLRVTVTLIKNKSHLIS